MSKRNPGETSRENPTSESDKQQRRDKADEYAAHASDPSGDVASGGGEHPE
jgi:hypothetical protein